MEDETTDNTTDATSRRIGSLKAVIISMLYDNNGLMIKERHLKEKCSDIQPKEIAACLLICNLLMPYIPDKKNRYSMPYQIPFILMASLSLKR
jgi:regulator of replication initiation timing